MVTNQDQLKFNLEVLREGLSALASTTEKQLALNKGKLQHLDDIFDPMPLDYLPWLVTNEVITPQFVSSFSELYEQIEKSAGHLEWQEEDDFIASNNHEMKQWREIALTLLRELNGV